jgi:hypothetical protein
MEAMGVKLTVALVPVTVKFDIASQVPPVPLVTGAVRVAPLALNVRASVTATAVVPWMNVTATGLVAAVMVPA